MAGKKAWAGLVDFIDEPGPCFFRAISTIAGGEPEPQRFAYIMRAWPVTGWRRGRIL